MTITTSTIVAPTAVLEPNTMLRRGDESGLDNINPTGTNDSTSEADNSGRRSVDKKIMSRSSRGRSITNVASYKDNDNSESEEDNDEDIEDDKSLVSFRHADTDIPESTSSRPRSEPNSNEPAGSKPAILIPISLAILREQLLD